MRSSKTGESVARFHVLPESCINQIRMTSHGCLVIRSIKITGGGAKELTDITWDKTFTLINMQTGRAVKCGPLKNLRVIVKDDKIITWHYNENREAILSLWNAEGYVDASLNAGRFRYKGDYWKQDEKRICVADDATVFFTKLLHIWNPQLGSVQTLLHPGTKACLYQNGTLYSCSRDGSICLWDIKKGELRARYCQVTPLMKEIKWARLIQGDKLIMGFKNKDVAIDLSFLASLKSITKEKARKILEYVKKSRQMKDLIKLIHHKSSAVGEILSL